MPLPARDIGLTSSASAKPEDELARYLDIRDPKVSDLNATISALIEENQRMRQIVDSVQANTDTLVDKFPIQGQDQNMQRSWTGVSYKTYWGDYSASFPVQYRKLSEGAVFMRGIAKITGAGYAYSGANSMIATLPTGIRPVTYVYDVPVLVYDAGYGYYTMQWLRIETNGDIKLVGGVQAPGGSGSGANGTYIVMNFSFFAV